MDQEMTDGETNRPMMQLMRKQRQTLLTDEETQDMTLHHLEMEMEG